MTSSMLLQKITLALNPIVQSWFILKVCILTLNAPITTAADNKGLSSQRGKIGPVKSYFRNV